MYRTPSIPSLLGKKDTTDAKQELDSLMERIGLETKLSAVGIKSENDIETILDNAFKPDKVKNNLRKVTRQAMRKILEMIY